MRAFRRKNMLNFVCVNLKHQTESVNQLLHTKRAAGIALCAIQVVLLIFYFADGNKYATDKLKNTLGKYTESIVLSERCVTAFCQDSKQSMWIGTTDGLNIFTGTDFKQLRYDHEDSTTIPDNNIQCITRDSRGNMWVGTSNGVARYEGWMKFKRFSIPVSSQGVKQIVDFGTRGVLVNNSFDVFLVNGDTVKPFYHFTEDHLYNHHIYADRSGGYWIIEPQQIRHFNAAGTETMPPVRKSANVVNANLQGDTVWVGQSRWLTGIDLRRNRIFLETKEQLPILPTSICSPVRGQVYLNSSFHGLYRYDMKDGTLTKVNDADLHLHHKDVMVSTFYSDAEKNMWVGFESGGFQVMSKNTVSYEKTNNRQLNQQTGGRIVTCLKTACGMVVGSAEDEVFCYDPSLNAMSKYLYKDIFSDSPYFRQTLSDVVPFDGHRAWLISNVRILSCTLDGGKINVLNRVYSRTHVGPVLGYGVRVGDDIVVTSGSKYLLRAKFGASVCDSIPVGMPSYNEKSLLAKLPDGRVLIVMKNLDMAVFDPASNKVSPYKVEKAAALADAAPATICVDTNRRVWIGTRHNGLCRLFTDSRRVEPVAEVPLNNVISITDDAHGRLWMCSHDDILTYAPDTKSVNYGYYTPDNNSGRSLYYHNSCLTDNGKAIAFGTSQGCVTLPLNAMKNKGHNRLTIRELQITTADGTKKGLRSDFADGTHFTLSHDDNHLSVYFSSANYGNRERLMYQYRMDGYDTEWSAPSFATKAQYSNLPSGTYTFRVRITTPTQNTTPVQETTLRITIKPAFYASAAAWYFYIVCILMVAWQLQIMYLRAQKNKLRIEQLANERERDRHTNEMNMNFFANISHEFRNPLTLISGPLLMLKADQTLPRQARKSLSLVCQSVNRMLVLIDQMLDFNKLENDVLSLHVSECDAVSEIGKLAGLCAESAHLRGINLAFECTEDNIYAWADRDKLEKIMSNLLTNALKHTPDNGAMKVSMACSGGTGADNARQRQLRVTVYNNGPHIDDDKLGDIFKRYYQAKGAKADHRYGWGTGIGLYYVKRLVHLHHGKISVANVEGGGVAFTFTLPIDRQAYSDSETADIAGQPMQLPDMPADDSTEELVDTNRNEVNETANKPKILIVDDDTQVGQYIRSIFADEYVVVNKYSAESALDEIENIKPDIVLSDVIMGDMDGYEFCRHLKSDLMTCHLPVVLITAKGNVNEQIEGLGHGANAYVTKPFDPRYLKALVKSLLDNAELLRKKLGEAGDTRQPVDGLAEQDRIFLDNLYALMEKHVSEQNLSVSVISQELLISHSKFNYKLKELTGETPGNLFRKFKLNKAAKLLREGQHNVSEVAYITGFGTVSYFSVAFKKQFGVSPSEYK